MKQEQGDLYRMLARACTFDVRAAKKGYAEEYYALFDNAPEYLARVVPALGFVPREATAIIGEEGLVVQLSDGQRRAVVKIIAYGVLLTTVAFYRLLRGTGVPVPQVLHFDDTRRVIPYEYMVMEALPGQEAGQLPAAAQHAAGVLTGQALCRAHEIEPGGFGYPLPGGGWSSPSWLEALRHAYMDDGSMARKHEVFSPAEIARIEALTLGNRSLEIAAPRLIHGDPSPANSLCIHDGDDVALTSLIDPSVVIGGDPMFDLVAGTSSADDFAAGLWDGYTQGRPLTPDEQNRYDHLCLFTCYWTACWQYITGRDHLGSKETALRLLHALS